MNVHRCLFWPLFLMICLAVIPVACERFSPTPAPQAPTAAPADTPTEEPPTPTSESEAPTATLIATATPTVSGGGVGPTPTEDVSAQNRCAGLAGELEIQVLVGPAEAVGLEPVAVGSVPFAAAAESPYTVQGQAPISYAETLALRRGTFSVSVDLDIVVEGECSGEEGAEQLDLKLKMTGEQLTVVDVEGFRGEYPWSGEHLLNLTFPLEEGATAQGEGWMVVLHLAG